MRRKFTTTLDDEILKKAKIQAIKEGRSVAEILEELLSGYLDESPATDEMELSEPQ